MSFTAAELASLVSAELFGPADRYISGAAVLEEAGANDLAFVADARHLSRMKDCRAGALLAPREHAAALAAASPDLAVLGVDRPQSVFQTILPQFRKIRPRPTRGIAPSAIISPSATIGPDCYIGPNVVIGDDVTIGSDCDIHAGVVIGDGCQIANSVTLHPNVVLYHDVQLGSRVSIYAAAVLGADGFGYRLVDGAFQKIPQLGHVVIGDDVEIGAGTAIDRGAIGPTVIGEGTKIDNMVMIGHNCQIGRHNVIASQVGMAGSCSTGDYVRMGGQIGVKDHVHINSGCSIGAKSGVSKDVPAGEAWVGYPATPESEQKRLVFALRRVPELRSDFKQLQKQVQELQAQLAQLQAAAEGPTLRAAG